MLKSSLEQVQTAPKDLADNKDAVTDKIHSELSKDSGRYRDALKPADHGKDTTNNPAAKSMLDGFGIDDKNGKSNGKDAESGGSEKSAPLKTPEEAQKAPEKQELKVDPDKAPEKPELKADPGKAAEPQEPKAEPDKTPEQPKSGGNESHGGLTEPPPENIQDSPPTKSEINA